MKRPDLMTLAFLVLWSGCGGAQATTSTLPAIAAACPTAPPAVGSVCHATAVGAGAGFCSYPGVATLGAHGAAGEHVCTCDEQGHWACFDKPATEAPMVTGGPTGVAADPAGTRIVARVVSIQKASDGWGAWAQLAIENAPSAGTTVRAFVPPPLVESLTASGHFEGTMVTGGPEETYSLVPPAVR